jgi:hypothetical protein
MTAVIRIEIHNNVTGFASVKQKMFIVFMRILLDFTKKAGLVARRVLIIAETFDIPGSPG